MRGAYRVVILVMREFGATTRLLTWRRHMQPRQPARPIGKEREFRHPGCRTITGEEIYGSHHADISTSLSPSGIVSSCSCALKITYSKRLDHRNNALTLSSPCSALAPLAGGDATALLRPSVSATSDPLSHCLLAAAQTKKDIVSHKQRRVPKQAMRWRRAA